MAESITLAHQDGREYRKVTLDEERDGSLRISTHDMGPTVEHTWGDDDYEFWTEIKPAAFKPLLVALLKERFNGDLEATDKLRDFCKEHGVQHTWMCWR